MTKQKIKNILICFLLSALCISSLFMAWKEYSEQSADRHALEVLATQVNESVTEPEPLSEANESDTTAPPEETATHKRNLAPLIEQNGDCIGWLCIPDTEIDYPVMHTPSDSQKYLHLNFDGEYSTAGIPFLDYRCTLDGNLIVFGHNMKNETMFGSLDRYLDEAYRQAHSTIEFETPAGLRLFNVTKVICTDTSDIWYDCTAPDDGKTYLILSTCHSSSKSGRLLVIAEEIQG